MTLVDSHVHLDHQQFRDDLDALLDRARAAGVEGMLTIGTGDGPPQLDCAVAIADRHEDIWATVGVHPHDASKMTPQALDELASLAKEKKVLAVGEIGLDFHYDFSPRDVQREVFVAQLRLARAAGKPIIIHTREAWPETLEVLRQEWSGPGIMHCFTGDSAQAREALDLGLHLAFGGVVTFRTADAVREAARIVPEDRLLLETDAPYLAPIPYRGKRNEPAYMVETAKKLAEVRGVDAAHLAKVTTQNFQRLFGLTAGDRPN